MRENVLTRARRRFGVGLAVFASVAGVWLVLPGMPVLWAPRANAKEREAGRALFVHEWQPYDSWAKGDGLGPVFNARACAACHFQGGVGGGGGNDHNVQAFEAHPTKERPDVEGGLIHKYAVANKFIENVDALRKFFPIVPGGVVVEGGCQVLVHDFDPVHTESINSTALFGAGWVDRLSGKTIVLESEKASIKRIGRELNGDFHGIVPGRPHILPDGRVGKFGWKAQFATLEEFVAAACANEIGLGNPRMEQAQPRVNTKYPKMAADLDAEQFRSLVAFVDTLPRPEEIVPDDSRGREQVEHGRDVFRSVGCASCHTPDLGGVTGLYSDFLLHRLDDRSQGGGGYNVKETPAVPLPHEHPKADEWKTPLLWGVADSAPYFHDGRSPTLEAAIDRHHGDAQSVLEIYQKLGQNERAALVMFLKSLKAPHDATPAPSYARDVASLRK